MVSMDQVGFPPSRESLRSHKSLPLIQVRPKEQHITQCLFRLDVVPEINWDVVTIHRSQRSVCGCQPCAKYVLHVGIFSCCKI